ncbi:MAG: isocitrate/isopropylmalate family dehydrogenase [Pyrinomonadaceae bacterium]
MVGIKLLVLPGDGIGPEISEVVLQCLEALAERCSLDLRPTVQQIGLAHLKESGTTMPADLVERAKTYDGIILGPLSTSSYPPGEGSINVSALLRRELDLFANIRPSRAWPGLEQSRAAMDLVIVRENTEGFLADRVMYAGAGEFMPTPDLALAVRKISASASRRIAETAFALARERRGKVTAAHKVNSLKLSDGLFLREVRSVASANPQVEFEEVLVDAMAALLIRCPERFDVVVTTNLFGDILSDEAAELAGSLGLAPSLNVGDEYAVAQAVHGSAPDIAGEGKANPGGLLLSTAMLLEWMARRKKEAELSEAATALRRSVERAVMNPQTRTRDLGGQTTTSQFGQIVSEAILQDEAIALARASVK